MANRVWWQGWALPSRDDPPRHPFTEWVHEVCGVTDPDVIADDIMISEIAQTKTSEISHGMRRDVTRFREDVR